MEASGHEMIQVLAIGQLVDRLLDPPALTIDGGQPPGMQALDAGHVDPGAAPIGGMPRAEGEQLETGIPMAPAQTNGPTGLVPTPLLIRQGGEAGANAHGALEAENKGNAGLL